ncbi:MAG: GMC family oxidoreductase [Pseudomonadota bacterium]
MTAAGDQAVEADVLIVGAGMAGAAMAAVLARGGRDVLVLESGPDRSLTDLVSSQIWARRLKWSGAPVRHEGAHGFAHNLNTASGVGGAALHHYATWPRFHNDVFRLRSAYGRGLDWPFEYETLRPYYDRVQSEVGVAGDAEAETWRPEGAPYPLPPLPVFGQGAAIARGFEAAELPVAPLPAAILTAPYKGRAACLYDGWCDAGCPVGALANPLATYLREALEAGARVRPHCHVVRVLSNGDRASGVAFVDADGEPRSARAKVVVLAASAIQNPRILLNSPDKRRTDGAIGDRSGALGRYFMLDGLALAYGLFDDVETDPHMGVSAGQLMHRRTHAARGKDQPFGGYQWQIAPSMKPNDIFGIAISRSEIFGQELTDFMPRAVRHIGSMAGMVEETARIENRIELASAKGRSGAPLATVVHDFDEDARALWTYVRDEGARIMKAAGATEVWTGPMNAGHLLGGTIMGASPESSVTDGYGRVHDVENLYIGGSGLFPSSGGVSPTFTLTALAVRAAEHIAEKWAQYAD